MTRQPPLPGFVCPCCGCRLLTAEATAALVGVSVRTLHRLLETGQVEGATREPVPGGNARWLVPLEAAERLAVQRLGALLRRVDEEIGPVRAATQAWRSASKGPDEQARLASDDALWAVLGLSRRATKLFGQAYGWNVTAESAPFIHQLEAASGAYQQAIYAQDAQTRLEALDRLDGAISAALDLAGRLTKGGQPA